MPATTQATRLDEQLCFALYAASNAIVRAYRPLLAALDLTYPQYLVLLALWEQNPLPVNEIAAQLELPAHGVTPVVGRLVAAGLVTRTRDATDGRVTLVGLTARGAELETHAAAVQDAVACRTALSPAALARLRSQLHAVARNLADDDG